MSEQVVTANSYEQEPSDLAPVTSRRNFLQALTGLAVISSGVTAGLAFDKYADTVVPQPEIKQTSFDESPIVDPVAFNLQKEAGQPKDIGLHAAAATAAVIGETVITSGYTVLNKGLGFGLEDGPEVQEIIQNDGRRDAYSTFHAVAMAPLSEELVLRALPSFYADYKQPERQNSRRWLLGTVMSSLFAAGHYHLKVDGRRIWPIPQFVSGQIYWYLQRRNGYMTAALAHSAHNAFMSKPLVRQKLSHIQPHSESAYTESEQVL